MPEHELEGKTNTIIDEWCESILRNIWLWRRLKITDATMTDEYPHPARSFATQEGITRLETMSETGVMEQQGLIEPGVQRLFQYLLTHAGRPPHPAFGKATRSAATIPVPAGAVK